MIKKVILLYAIIVLVLPASFVFSHPGGKDELGGHFRNSDCMYLLHEPTELAKSAKDINEFINLIQKYNSNECKYSLTPDKIDTEGFVITGHSNQTSHESSSDLVVGQTYKATLEKCVDGDSAHFNINGKVYKTRFLYIDTPEYTTEKEPFGKEASEFACQYLNQGTIVLETDGPSLYDKYNRLLVWVWVDGQLFQEIITKEGLVKDFYDYGSYKYEDKIHSALEFAKNNRLGIYNNESKDNSVVSSSNPKESNSNKEQQQTEDSSKESTNDLEKDKNNGSMFSTVIYTIFSLIIIVFIVGKIFG